MSRRNPDVLTVLGLSLHDVESYRRIRPFTGSTVEDLVQALGDDDLPELLDRLVAAGVAKLDDDRVVVHAPAALLADVVATEADQLREVVDRLERLRASVPTIRGLLSEEVNVPTFPDSEVRDGQDIHRTLRAWVTESQGGLMWLRPDQWRLPEEPAMTRAVQRALARGQRSRAIYPARVLEEAPESLFDRIDAGEEVRLVTEVPSRLAVVEGVGAVLPEVWGVSNGRRVILRQDGVMAALTVLFEEVWDRAVVLPGGQASDHNRRLLLEQMARGAKDEQIARVLGLSLRTVRRRVADLLLDLGVDTRFQAGVEAVRRGWI